MQQGCFLHLYCFFADYRLIMKTITTARNEILRTLTEQLTDLNFVANIALLPHIWIQMQVNEALDGRPQKWGLKLRMEGQR